MNFFLSLANPLLGMLIGIGMFVIWEIGVMIHMVTMSRMVFAGSFDRLLPARFADVSERFHTPHWSLILYGALASIYLTIWWNFGSFATLLNTSMLVPIGFALPMVATMLFPFVKRDLYIRAFGSMKGAASLVIASLIGVVAFAFYGIAETFPLISGVFLGTSLTLAYEVLMVLLLIGIGMYLMGRMRMARLGINIKSVYAEIPPE